MDKLAEIPSEYIEPYLVDFLMTRFEAVGMGLITPEKARGDLRGVEFFVNCYCGIHSKLATQNQYGNALNLSDEEFIEFGKIIIEKTRGKEC